MHDAMTKSILNAKIIFFDSNPIGRIITRFTKDFAVLDTKMPLHLILITFGVFRSISVVIVVCIINYWLVIPLFIAIILMVLV
jgi:ATP-binding cassette subfamily C (CFTR/MRP) protein 4